MRFFLILVATAIAVANVSLASAKPVSDDENNKISIYDDVNFDNKLQDALSVKYDVPTMKRSRVYHTMGLSNVVGSSLDLEGEHANVDTRARQVQRDIAKVRASSAEVDSPNADKFSSIAFNSREVRLMGPNQREIEMRDDLPSKMVAVIDNLRKEASSVWDQVSDKVGKGWSEVSDSLDKGWSETRPKLDKGWTDFKSMVGSVVSPSSKPDQDRYKNLR